MNTLEMAKQKYDTVPIPEELSDRVLSEIRKADLRQQKSGFVRKWCLRVAAAAAVLAIGFGIKVNTDTVFAAEMGSVPVIGKLVRVLTVQSYRSQTEDLGIAVDIPKIEMISADLKGSTDKINEEIYDLCQQYVRDTTDKAREYKEAFLATGGTEEEWKDHNLKIRVNYEIMSQSERYLSVAIIGSQNWAAAYNETHYYNFDLKTGKQLDLKDILGKDYANIAETAIRRQIDESPDAALYSLENWNRITKDTAFYLNQSGNPVIVFDKYEIAPGSMGYPKFEIRQ